MSNYVKSTDFAAKDTLTTGNPLKLIKGTEINDEFNNLQTAIATKADLSSPALSGNPTCATQAIGNNSTRLANTAFVQQEISDAEAAIAITGGTITAVDITDVIITDANISGLVAPIDVADGGTGANTLLANAVLLGNGTTALQTVAPTTAGNVIRTNGTTWQSQNNLLSETAKTATGSSIDFTAIPSWVKRINIVFNGVSTTGSLVLQVQLGSSGGIESTGYTSVASGITSIVGTTSITSGFHLTNGTGASETLTGLLTICLISGTTYVSSGTIFSATNKTGISSGVKTLTGVLDRIKITTASPSTDTFDAGSINILYE